MAITDIPSSDGRKSCSAKPVRAWFSLNRTDWGPIQSDVRSAAEENATTWGNGNDPTLQLLISVLRRSEGACVCVATANNEQVRVCAGHHLHACVCVCVRVWIV